MFRRKWMTLAAASSLSLALPACNTGSNGTGSEAAAVKIEIGTPLYPAEKPEAIPLPEALEQTIVVPNAVIRMDKKQMVATEVDGKLVGIGTNLPAGTKVDPGDKNIYYDPNDKDRQIPYRRLRIGDRVTKGQTVCLLDDLKALIQIEQSQMVIIYSEKAIKEATLGAVKIEESLKILRTAGTASSQVEVLNAEATLARYNENVYTSEREKAKATGDLKNAELMRKQHHCDTAVTGIVTNILREPGEFVKAGEPLMEILSTEDVRVEGTMEAHFADTVKPGMNVLIEPTLPVGPDLKAGAITHRMEVTGVAVTANAKRPLVISASLDGTATVWDAMAPAGKPKTQTQLVHPVGVRSIAVTGPKVSKTLAATGGDDGRIRLWDVSNPDSIGTKPLSEFTEAHSAGIAALSFSPDGRYLASAAGREIYIWKIDDVTKPVKLYALPGDHKDAVTTLKFTPQAKLVTASRDKSVRVWTIGDKGGTVERTIDHRKANVDAVGVSSGGGRVLFDQDDGRIDVVSLADGQPVGSILNAAAGARFAGIALFSPDDSYVLTAGGDGDMRGELQVWVTPKPGGRGAEVRRLVTPYRAMPTCADFGPGFVVIGTQAGGVHLWTQDLLKGVAKERFGRVISVIRADSRNVKVRVETNALGELGLLQDKSTATLIIRPGDQMTPPAALPGVPMNVQIPMPTVILPAGGLVIPTVTLPK